MPRETMGRRRSCAQVIRPVRPIPPMVAAYQSGFSVREQSLAATIRPHQFEARNVAAEGAGDLVVLAVDIVGDGAAEGDVLGAGSDGKEEAARNSEVEDLRERNAGLGGQDAGLGVEIDQAVHAGGLEQRAVLQQADIAVAATESDRKRAVLRARQNGGKIALPVERDDLRAILGIAAPGLELRWSGSLLHVDRQQTEAWLQDTTCARAGKPVTVMRAEAEDGQDAPPLHLSLSQWSRGRDGCARLERNQSRYTPGQSLRVAFSSRKCHLLCS